MIRKSLVIVIVLCLIGRSAFANPPDVSAQSAILTELTSGRVLYSKNADERLPMASTTKIMTALVALDEKGEELDASFEISEMAAGVEGSSMYLEKGEKMTLKELLYGLMLSSGNDAAVAVAEFVAGGTEEFVELMNQKAQELGLADTHFVNPNGLPDEEHYSTAKDMARLTEAAMKNKTFAEIVATKSYTVSGEGKAYPRLLSNHNKLLRMCEGCIGVKTGFTKAAGRCLVSATQREGMTLICVTLNAPNDWREHSALYDYGFDTYTLTEVSEREIPVTAVDIENSYEGAIPIYVQDSVLFPLKEGEEVYKRVEIDENIRAPLKAGEGVGRIVFEYGEDRKTAGETKLVVISDVAGVPILDGIGTSIAEGIKMVFEMWINIL